MAPHCTAGWRALGLLLPAVGLNPQAREGRGWRPSDQTVEAEDLIWPQAPECVVTQGRRVWKPSRPACSQSVHEKSRVRTSLGRRGLTCPAGGDKGLYDIFLSMFAL